MPPSRSTASAATTCRIGDLVCDCPIGQSRTNHSDAQRSETPMHGDGLNPRSPDELDAMLLRAAELLEERHVVAETGRRGAGMLRTAVAQQRYRDHAEAPVALADALTSDLRLASGDNHLFVEHLGDEGTPADDWIERWRQEGPSRNWGISAVRLLPGNIGYLKL